MPIARFLSRDECDVVIVELERATGGAVAMHLLVDSGFTGQSAMVLSNRHEDVFLAPFPEAESVGALSGPQRRALVNCLIPELGFRRALIAIVAPLEGLALPEGVDGIVGLRFLRMFAQWGAERLRNGEWRFVLRTDETVG